MENVIEVRNLVKEYKQLRAVDGLSLDVREGEILGLLGPNGSGKSTLINCILALLRYQEGEIRMFGQEMGPSAYDLKRKIGVVFQDVAVFEELTVYENVDYFCGLYVKDRRERKQCVEEAIELVGIGDFKKFRPKQLSGGLLRRLNIACGVAHRPKLVLLDEPTVAVDPQSRNGILEGIRKLREKGATIVYVTHYMEEVEMICDRVIILDKGKVLAEGTCDALKKLAKIEEKVTVETACPSEELMEQLRGRKHVEAVSWADGMLRVSYRAGTDNLSNLIQFLRDQGVSYQKIYSERPTLNDVFLELTGKELRD